MIDDQNLNSKFSNTRVETFIDYTASSLQNEINEFFKEHPGYTLVDIKYSISDKYSYSAIMIYRTSD